MVSSAPWRNLIAEHRSVSSYRSRQLVYRRAAELFSEATNGRTLHQLRHSALTHAAEDGTNTPILLARSRHASVRSLERYARPSPEAVARHVAEHDAGRCVTRIARLQEARALLLERDEREGWRALGYDSTAHYGGPPISGYLAPPRDELFRGSLAQPITEKIQRNHNFWDTLPMGRNLPLPFGAINPSVAHWQGDLLGKQRMEGSNDDARHFVRTRCVASRWQIERGPAVSACWHWLGRPHIGQGTVWHVGSTTRARPPSRSMLIRTTRHRSDSPPDDSSIGT